MGASVSFFRIVRWLMEIREGPRGLRTRRREPVRGLHGLLFCNNTAPSICQGYQSRVQGRGQRGLFFFLAITVIFLLVTLTIYYTIGTLTNNFVTCVITLSYTLTLLYTIRDYRGDRVNLSVYTSDFLAVYCLLDLCLSYFTCPRRPTVYFRITTIILPVLFAHPTVKGVLHAIVCRTLFVNYSIAFGSPTLIPVSMFGTILFKLVNYILSACCVHILASGIITHYGLGIVTRASLGARVPGHGTCRGRVGRCPLHYSGALDYICISIGNLRRLGGAGNRSTNSIVLGAITRRVIQRFNVVSDCHVNNSRFITLIISRPPHTIQRQVDRLITGIRTGNCSITINYTAYDTNNVRLRTLVGRTRDHVCSSGRRRCHHYNVPRKWG